MGIIAFIILVIVLVIAGSPAWNANSYPERPDEEGLYPL